MTQDSHKERKILLSHARRNIKLYFLSIDSTDDIIKLLSYEENLNEYTAKKYREKESNYKIIIVDK